MAGRFNLHALSILERMEALLRGCEGRMLAYRDLAEAKPRYGYLLRNMASRVARVTRVLNTAVAFYECGPRPGNACVG